MALRLSNTLTQKATDFEPLTPGKAGIYVCGMTTYDLAHAGHARTYTTFDVLVRHLRARGYEVTHVRNVTDVDDKILKRAAELGEEPTEFSARMTEGCNADLAAIGCQRPDHEPRVSTHIPEIIALIEALIAKGNAYVAETTKGKDVYFSVRDFPPYGKLSHRNIDDLKVGARIDVGEYKHDPLDFALWKGDEGAAWGFESPWGKGRPGWHIECSAMAQKYLGEHFDIHCGGMDLIFPHHENEVAQSEAVFGPDLAKYWVHGGFLNADNEKMSKSLGNFVTIRDVLARNDQEAFRLYLLGTHYHGPMAFELEHAPDGRVIFPGIDEAERRIDYFYSTRTALEAASGPDVAVTTLREIEKQIAGLPEAVLGALDNNLSTPQALAVLADFLKVANDLVKRVPKAKDEARGLCGRAVSALAAACVPLGLMQTSPDEYAARTKARRIALRKLDEASIDAKVAERTAARASKDFARADALRAELTALGVEVADGPSGSTWRVSV